MATQGNAQRGKAPRSEGTRQPNALETAAELAADALQTTLPAAESMPAGVHAAPMGGMELLVEIAKLAETVLATRTLAAKPHHIEPVDPRRCVDPRKRILPR